MFDISTDIVAEIVVLARDPDRGDAEFDAFVSSLTEEERAEIVALMWIGRGTFDPGEWDEAVETALTEATTPTASYLRGTPHLADHLENGLDALGLSARAIEDAFR